MNLIYQWVDLFWLLIVFLAIDKKHWLVAVSFVLSCMFMMRLQVELMISIGYEFGILNLIKSDVFTRGLIVYGIMYLLYFLLGHYSAGTKKEVFLAASITIFFAAMVLSMGVMAL